MIVSKRCFWINGGNSIKKFYWSDASMHWRNYGCARREKKKGKRENFIERWFDNCHFDWLTSNDVWPFLVSDNYSIGNCKTIVDNKVLVIGSLFFFFCMGTQMSITTIQFPFFFPSSNRNTTLLSINAIQSSQSGNWFARILLLGWLVS